MGSAAATHRPRAGRAAPTVRCAIYTRKSSEEGLEQEFNSLHAQREACEAYIASQRSEGWQCLPEQYDDGGISGGTMDRPGLRRLLQDVEAGRVDTVVVYKVDRLTRALSDFAKIVEVFDAAGASFVSVTQSFNTTTSMGRLTLNMLLSFAQFEREVTSERIRDKIAASKKKGLWTGGNVPLGYRAIETKLVPNEAEAQTVQLIFERYLHYGSVAETRASLIADDIRGRAPRDEEGQPIGPGKPFAHDGPLYHLLQNRLYRGQIAYQGAVYDGQHEAIVDAALFDAVQARLKANRVRRAYGTTARAPALLAGLLFDEDGQAVSPTHSNKAGKRYRYYASQSLIGRKARDAKGLRVPAADLDALVLERIRDLLLDQGALQDLLSEQGVPSAEWVPRFEAATTIASMIDGSPDCRHRTIVRSVIHQVVLAVDRIEIVLQRNRLCAFLNSGPVALDAPDVRACGPSETENNESISLTAPASIKRSGTEMRLVLQERSASQESKGEPDRSLIRLLTQAHRLRRMLIAHDDRSITELASTIGVTRSYFCRIVRLGFLAPDIVEAILDGAQPRALTATTLARLRDLPDDWNEQRSLLGFGAPQDR